MKKFGLLFAVVLMHPELKLVERSEKCAGAMKKENKAKNKTL